MRSISYTLAGLFCLGAVACSDVDPDSGQSEREDARVSTSDSAVGGFGGSGGFASIDAAASGGSGGAGGVIEADLGLDAAVAPDMAPDSASADPVVLSVVLTEQPQADTASASVSVTDAVELPDQQGCVVEYVDPDQAGPPPPASFDGGTVTLSGLSGPNLVFELQGQTYQALGVVDDEELFDEGAIVHVSGGGGPAIGAFELDVTAPQEVRINSPSNFSSYDRDEGLSVSWRAAGAQSMLVTLFPVAPFSVDPVAGNWIFCGTDDSGQFFIPANIMGQLPSGGGLLAVTRFAVASTEVGASTAVITISTSSGVASTYD